MRRFRLILALYAFVWLNFVVPGHTRGIITLPGADFLTKGTACCEHDSREGKNKAPTSEEKSNCAICFVAATYTVAVFDLVDLQPAELVEQPNLEVAAQVVSREFPNLFWPTGPPCLI